MSTTASGPATPVAFRIAASGVFHRVDPFGGVDQPPSHVTLDGPTVGGRVAGSAGRMGGADGTVLELAGTGLGIVAVGEPSPPTHADAVSASSVRHHRKTMILVTGGTPDRGSRLWEDTGPMDEERRASHPLPISRRRFLERSAMAVAGGTLFACTGGKIVPHVSDTTAAIQTRWPIKRVVYVMLENQSFDNLFGRFPGVEGTTTGVMDGAEVPLTRCPDWLPGDLPHDRAAALNCWNGGKQDGFGTASYGDPWAYTQFEGNEVPNYWHWAREYALSDHF